MSIAATQYAYTAKKCGRAKGRRISRGQEMCGMKEEETG